MRLPLFCLLAEQDIPHHAHGHEHGIEAVGHDGEGRHLFLGGGGGVQQLRTVGEQTLDHGSTDVQ